MVKRMLTDQKKIAGLGNEYSDLVDFMAGVLPTRPASSLTDPEIRRLFKAIPGALEEGLGLRGRRHDFMKVRRRGGRCPNHPDVELIALRWGASHAYFCPVEQK